MTNIEEFNDNSFLESEEQNKQIRRRRTGAKKSNGKKVALSILVMGGIVASTIFGTQAYYSHKETKRAENLIAAYQTDDYCVLPSNITSNRSYDITYTSGEKLVNRLRENGVKYININGKFYTEEGINIAILTYDVTRIEYAEPIKVNVEGETIYMAPNGYELFGKQAYKYVTERETKIVPESDNYDYVSFEWAVNHTLVNAPQIVRTLPYSVLEESTLICDVADGATLNEYNECTATLEIAPKKR